MQNVSVSELKPHPRNEEFFDNISGQKWKEFLKSVSERGVIEPIVITADKTIVSGHHRVRACIELGIKEVPCEIRIYNTDDEVIQDLIETNIRQRGDVGGSEMKIAARIKELERIYGIKEGRPEKLRQNGVVSDKPKTQSDLAKEMGMSDRNYQRYKQLSNAIPELADALNEGKINKTTALAMMKQLSEEEQQDLIKQLDGSRITSVDIEEYKARINDDQKIISSQREKIQLLENRKPEVKEVVKEVIKEVVPADYEETKRALESARYNSQRADEDFKRVKEESEKIRKENEKLKERFKTEEVTRNADRNLVDFTIATNNFIRQFGGHVWAFNEINNVSEDTRKDFEKAIETLNAFTQQLISNMKGVTNE